MPFTVAFVAAVGRNSVGDWSAKPKIESIVAKYGGQMGAGLGNSTQPLTATFGVKEAAINAARDAWYLDDVEFAKVLEADVIPTAAIKESTEPAKPVTAQDMIEAVAAGAVTPTNAVAILFGQVPYTAVTSQAGTGPECCGDPRPLVAPGEPNPATATA